MLRLYGTPQTRTFRPLWMLEELGIPYELVKADFASGGTRTPEFLKINPNGHVPALVDGDLALCESLAINLYLAEKYGRTTLWPASEADRARAVLARVLQRYRIELDPAHPVMPKPELTLKPAHGVRLRIEARRAGR